MNFLMKINDQRTKQKRLLGLELYAWQEVGGAVCSYCLYCIHKKSVVISKVFHFLSMMTLST